MDGARVLAALSIVLAPSTIVLAQEPPPAPPQGDGAAGTATSTTEVPLSAYYDAMAQARLIAPETGSAERLRELVRSGEDLYLDDRFEEAQRVLYEAVESPRFRDFEALDEYRSAELMLAASLHRMGALRSAWRYLERIVGRGVADPYFGPAYRRAVDVALAGADLQGAIARLEALVPADGLPADAANELLYVKGRERYDAQDWEASARLFEQVGRQSRFYANARYLQGVIATQANRLDDAEAHFCAIATTPDTDQFTFFVDRRYFEIRDLTWLALGRVAHEGRRPEDAFYYYFQVPQDSARVAEALFESAWAMYEGDDFDTAIDLLDQLETRFPDSASAHEASLLRGYIHLARCEFEESDRLFRAFQARFTPVVYEVDAILQNPARQERLIEELIAVEARRENARSTGEGRAPGEGQAAPSEVHSLLLSLLTVDPSFYRLYTELRTLDAEAARSGRVDEELGALLARLNGSEAPRAAAEADDGLDEITTLRRDLDGARAVLRALTEQLEAMRRQGAPAERVRELEREVAQLGERTNALTARLDELARQAPAETATASGEGLEGMLARDRAAASRFGARVADVRARMLAAANDSALRALQNLRRDLGGHLRRSRIGRIDAVMGSKRRIEIQIESLAAGRFPAELQDPLAIQGLLRDDEEYWPFEGEYWADEFEEDPDVGEEDEEALREEEAALDAEPDDAESSAEAAE